MNTSSHLTSGHPSAEMISALHDGQLVANDVAQHLADCSECALELQRLAALSEILGNNIPSLSQIGRVRLHQQIDLLLDSATDSSLVRFGLRISGIAASVLLVGSACLLLMGGQSRSTTQAAPPWVGVAVTSDADTVVRNAATPAAAIYLADASSSDVN